MLGGSAHVGSNFEICTSADAPSFFSLLTPTLRSSSCLQASETSATHRIDLAPALCLPRPAVLSSSASPCTMMLMPGSSPYALPSALAATGSPALADSPGISQKDTTFTKIFVGGLPYHTTDKSLREHFEVYGEIEEAVVITDRQSGKSRGYGFVSTRGWSGKLVMSVALHRVLWSRLLSAHC